MLSPEGASLITGSQPLCLCCSVCADYLSLYIRIIVALVLLLLMVSSHKTVITLVSNGGDKV